MDEVDKIIVHSLKQLGCKVETENGDSTNFSLEHFTPDSLVKAVSRCLEEINLTQMQDIPKSLPKTMAQKFIVATKLAELCTASGYRGDIGYQTFLYPNVIDTRRLFMYLIECLPKEQETITINENDETFNSEYSIIMREVKRKIGQQLKAPWLPPYCRHLVTNRELWKDCISLNMPFEPLLNLTLMNKENGVSSSDNPIKHQWPSVFQQVANTGYDLISSVLHKNALDFYEATSSHLLNNQYVCGNNQTHIAKIRMHDDINEKKETNLQRLNPIEEISQEIRTLKLQNDQILNQRNESIKKLNDLNQENAQLILIKDQLTEKLQFYERCALILENPQENIQKLEELIQKTKTRRQILENKWQDHKCAALQRLHELEALKKTKQLCTLEELDIHIKQLENELQDKRNRQMELSKEVKSKIQNVNVANRIEYTQRIHEIIANIRKQDNDINKILEDTRELQKQLNMITGQLQRQFNYTDDLLFQSAKYDFYAKQAYKLLATLHTSCNEICKLVGRSGQMSKDLLELEVQIDYERRRNVAESLKQITIDIQNIQDVIKNMEADIQATEKIPRTID